MHIWAILFWSVLKNRLFKLSNEWIHKDAAAAAATATVDDDNNSNPLTEDQNLKKKHAFN